jgi:hypothetical protein
MTTTDQTIYEEALRRAGISTSATPLSYPGFPPKYESYLRLVSTPHGSAQVRSLVGHSQLARFEAEMHNLKCEQENQQALASAQARRQDVSRKAYQAMTEAELALFKEFKEAQEVKKREEEAAVALKAALEAAAKEEERAAAIQLFREMLTIDTNVWYGDSENEILRKGKIMKEIGPGGLVWPHGFEKMWRERRYKGKVEWHNYTNSICDGGWTPAKNGREWDGWPIADEADTEVRKIINEEWKMFLNFCLRYTERKESSS